MELIVFYFVLFILPFPLDADGENSSCLCQGSTDCTCGYDERKDDYEEIDKEDEEKVDEENPACESNECCTCKKLNEMMVEVYYQCPCNSTSYVEEDNTDNHENTEALICVENQDCCNCNTELADGETKPYQCPCGIKELHNEICTKMKLCCLCKIVSMIVPCSCDTGNSTDEYTFTSDGIDLKTQGNPCIQRRYCCTCSDTDPVTQTVTNKDCSCEELIPMANTASDVGVRKVNGVSLTIPKTCSGKGFCCVCKNDEMPYLIFLSRVFICDCLTGEKNSQRILPFGKDYGKIEVIDDPARKWNPEGCEPNGDCCLCPDRYGRYLEPCDCANGMTTKLKESLELPSDTPMIIIDSNEEDSGEEDKAEPQKCDCVNSTLIEKKRKELKFDFNNLKTQGGYRVTVIALKRCENSVICCACYLVQDKGRVKLKAKEYYPCDCNGFLDSPK